MNADLLGMVNDPRQELVEEVNSLLLKIGFMRLLGSQIDWTRYLSDYLTPRHLEIEGLLESLGEPKHLNFRMENVFKDIPEFLQGLDIAFFITKSETNIELFGEHDSFFISISRDGQWFVKIEYWVRDQSIELRDYFQLNTNLETNENLDLIKVLSILACKFKLYELKR